MELQFVGCLNSMEKEKIVYLVASPFQFLASLFDFCEKKEKYNQGLVYYFRYKNDNNKYDKILKKLNIKNLLFLETYIDDIAMLSNKKKSLYTKINNRLSKFKTILKIKDEISQYFPIVENIKIGDRTNWEFLYLSKLVNKNIKLNYVGDGASLVWDKDLYIKQNLINKVFYKILDLPNPNNIKVNQEDFFKKQWKFIDVYYTQLPIKDEIWVFGQNNYQNKPASSSVYSDVVKEAISDGKGFDFEDEYLNSMKKIKEKFKESKIYYFPHRNEIVSDKLKEIFEISNFGYFAEILPVMIGYLPKTIIGTSTTIFSYSNINRYIDNKVVLYFYPFTKSINSVYQEYNAINLEEILQ
jgi:hypothetical protein